MKPLNSNFYSFIFCVCTFLTSNLLTAQTTEQHIGESTYQMVKKRYGIYTNDSILSLIKKVGKKLENNLVLKDSIKYFLLDTHEPNAFATAGGYVYVTRGLLAILGTEDELGCIMAHEITHVTKHHSRKTLEVKIIPAILDIPGNIIGELTDPLYGKLINLNIDYPAETIAAGFSRKHEREADIVGVDLAAKSGFDPFALASALNRLTNYILYFDSTFMEKDIFNDHPITEKRISYLKHHLVKRGYLPTPFTKGTTLPTLNGLIYGINPIYGVVNKNQYVHPKHLFSFLIPESWRPSIVQGDVTYESMDKRQYIFQSIDTSKKSIDLLIEQMSKKLNSTNFTLVKDTFHSSPFYVIKINSAINGLFYNIFYLPIPGKKDIIRLTYVYSVELTPFKTNEILQKLTFLQEKDLKKYYYHSVKIQPITIAKSVGELSDELKIADKNKEIFYLINGCTSINDVLTPKEGFMKFISNSSLGI
ncbi:MAG: M48 family metallopeptidase [Cytophagaceae bacterium]|jgi:hypothetical protein|nr:M48 family metallopeptidase [Cytophagaceae bacterium]